jgi:predicted extracellular nuclease
MNAANTVATATPAAALLAVTTYKIRVLGTVTNVAGGAGVPFTQPNGFTTATAGTCAASLVISQVYGAGGNTSNNASTFRNDFIELHNGGATSVDLTGYAVQYAATGGTSWQVTALPSVIVPAGGYFLVQEAAGGFTAPALPIPDATGTISMASGAGKVALTPSTTALSGSCPLGLTNDFVGYGTGTNCFEGTGPTATLGNILAALRNAGGCTDINDNKTDFMALTPVPRNAATAPSVCACFAGLTGEEANASFAEVDGVASSVSLP